MAQKVILWIGPVWPQIIAPAVPKDWMILTFDDKVAGGNGSDAYRRWALSLGFDPLTRLAPNATQILIAGFSRAHGAIEVLLAQAAAAGDVRITGLLALDSYYSSLGVTTPKPGFLNWCNFALAHNLPAIFTTSSGHLPTHQSASDSIKPLANALQLRETAIAIPHLPPPVKTFGRGGILWLDYQARERHEDHPLKLAQPILSTGVFFRSQPQQVQTSQFSAKQDPSPPPPTTPPNQSTVEAEKPTSNDFGVGLLVGFLVLGGLGAIGYSLMRPKPKETVRASHKDEETQLEVIDF